MKNLIKYLTIVAGLNIVAASCVEEAQKDTHNLSGSWKVSDLVTTDSSADMGMLLMALVGAYPDSMRFEQDSLKVVMHGKDSVSIEALKYTRKQDSLWVHNAGGKIEPIGVKNEGDTLVLAGNGYAYYLVR